MESIQIPTEPKTVLKGHKGPIYTVKFNSKALMCIFNQQETAAIACLALKIKTS